MAEKTIVCPHCQQELNIDEQYLGMEVECPICNQSFTAQAASSVKNAFQQIKNASAQLGNSVGENLRHVQFDAIKNTLQQIKNVAAARQEEQEEEEEENFRQMQLNAIDTNDPYAEDRLKLVKFFKKAEGVQAASGIAKILADVCDGLGVIFQIFSFILEFFSKADRKILYLFNSVQNRDMKFLENLDVLPAYGKKQSQLVADCYTLYSPAMNYAAETEGPDFKYAISKEDKSFLYSLEEVIKIFTFEDQLFIFKAYWDYTTGKLFDESTEAFFFRDITDISTKNSYEYMKMKNNISFGDAITKHRKTILIFSAITSILVALPSQSFNALYISFLTMLFIVSILCYLIEKSKTIKVLTKKCETFVISANSGNSIGITMLCKEWIKAKNGIHNQRTNGEKIIHAIRKMIEEKKVTVNE